MSRATAVLLAAISLGSATAATAQVIKPRPSSSTDRLPRPATIAAAAVVLYFSVDTD